MSRSPLALTHKDVESQVDELVGHYDGQIVRFSQPRASMQTPGIPDRRLRISGVAFWFEIKPPDDRLSHVQKVFLEAELASGSLAFCGGVEDLAEVITAVRELSFARSGASFGPMLDQERIVGELEALGREQIAFWAKPPGSR